MSANLPRFVIDTNVLFEGLTKQGGAPGLIVDVWLTGLMEVKEQTWDDLPYGYQTLFIMSWKYWQSRNRFR
jgi:hypothetical protein